MPSFFSANVNPLLNAHVGPALIFFAPYGTTFPQDISDVINLTGTNQWKPKAGWSVLGATKTGIKIERGFTRVDRTSDQSFGPFDTRPNQWTATVSTELLETTPTNLTIAWEGGAIFTNRQPVLTSLSAAANPGATSITVAGTGLAANDVIIVGGDMTQEWHTVQSVSGSTVTFATGESLVYPQPSGASVVKPGMQNYGFGHPRNLRARVLAVIAPLVKVSTQQKVNIDLFRMWAFRITRLGEGNKTMNLTQENDWVLPVTFHAYPDFTVGDETQDTFVVVDYTLA
jgi:hypothetical protein